MPFAHVKSSFNGLIGLKLTAKEGPAFIGTPFWIGSSPMWHNIFKADGFIHYGVIRMYTKFSDIARTSVCCVKSVVLTV